MEYYGLPRGEEEDPESGESRSVVRCFSLIGFAVFVSKTADQASS